MSSPRAIVAIGLFMLTVFVAGTLFGEEMKWYSYQEGMAKAKAENRYALVDFYTNWCGWCKRMDKTTYTDSTVIRLVKEGFVPIKVNAESQTSHEVNGRTQTEREIAMSLGIKSYPTTFLFNSDGTTLVGIPGYLPPADMTLILEYFKAGLYKTQSFDDFKKSKAK